MDDADELRTPGGLVLPGTALRWSFTHAQGAGGQHVNKTATRVTLEADTDAVQGSAAALARLRASGTLTWRVSSQASRSQWRNRLTCRERLAEVLDAAARPPGPTRRPSRPTRGSVERRLSAKRQTSEKKVGRRRSGSTEW